MLSNSARYRQTPCRRPLFMNEGKGRTARPQILLKQRHDGDLFLNRLPRRLPVDDRARARRSGFLVCLCRRVAWQFHAHHQHHHQLPFHQFGTMDERHLGRDRARPIGRVIVESMSACRRRCRQGPVDGKLFLTSSWLCGRRVPCSVVEFDGISNRRTADSVGKLG